jgi:hypothetical protein
MKETEYLSEAREFYFHDDLLHRRVAWMGLDSSDGPGYFEEYAQPPLLPWLILLVWKIAGMEIWLARLIIVFFSVVLIPLIYYISYELTRKKEVSILAAFFMTIMPLAVFFGRNIQPESPALFFMMLSLHYYLKWMRDFSSKHIIAASISFAIGALFKYTFMIFAIPFIIIFPFEKLNDGSWRKKLGGQIAIILLSMSPLILWALITKFTNVSNSGLFPYVRIHIFEVFSSVYWDNYYETIKGYLISNFTIFYIGLALIGLIFCLKEVKTLFCRFCLGSAIMAIPYFMLLSDFIRQHSYYQMPFLPLVTMAGACCLYRMSTFKIVRSKKLKYLIIIGFILFSLPQVKLVIDQHYDTIFFGLDVAGDSIRELSEKEDRLFISGHAQTVGMLWASDRYGAFLPASLEELKFAENERHMKWIFVYDSLGVSKLKENPEIWEYVSNNYSVKEIGILKNGESEKQLYLILKKGRSNNASKPDFGPPTLKRTYETSYGLLEFYSLRAV